MSVELATSGSQADMTGVARVTVTDPASEARDVGFYLTARGGRRIGPLTRDRNPSSGVFEKDVLLEPSDPTRVDIEVTFEDGAVLLAPHAMFGPRFEPSNPSPAVLSSFSATAAPSRINLSIAMGNSALWKCYARRGALPMIDGIATLKGDYLRFEERQALTTTIAATAGTWYVIALGFNAAGQPGPRQQATLEVAA